MHSALLRHCCRAAKHESAPLDVEGNLPPQVTFHGVSVHLLTERRQLVLIEIVRAPRRVDLDSLQNFARCRVANTKYVL